MWNEGVGWGWGLLIEKKFTVKARKIRKNKYKMPVGHIAHLRNQFKSINTLKQGYDYIYIYISINIRLIRRAWLMYFRYFATISPWKKM